MSEERMNGADILLYANTGTPSVPIWTMVAGQRNIEIQETLAAMDKSAKDSEGKKEYNVGMYDAKLTLDGAYCPTDAAYQALRDAIRGRQKILVRVKEEGTATLEGNGIITSSSVSGPYEEGGTYSMEIQIDGGFTTDPS